MEYYITEENNYINTENITNYNILNDNKQKIKFKTVLKELLFNWSITIVQMKVMYNYNINIDELMENITKIYFLNFRCSKEYLRERKRLLNDKKYRLKKLSKLRGY